MWQLPFKSIEADKDLLENRGYALEKDMIHARSLDADELTSKNNYAIDSQEVYMHELHAHYRCLMAGLHQTYAYQMFTNLLLAQ